MIHLIADERHACAHAHGELTVGSRGIPVQVGLSDDFDGLAVTICFQAGTERAEVVWYEGEDIYVPPQCLTKEGERLLVGVYGAKADGTVVIPTIWATAGIVKRGTDLTGVSPSDPEPDWTAQVQSIAAEAIETANAVKAAADAGEFDGYSPNASVTKSGDTATITITDKDGTTTASIRDGYDTSGSVVQDGTTAIITLTDHDGTTRAEVHDGISPSASVAQTETGATVTVTDRSGTTTARLTNGPQGPQGERGPKGDTGDGATRIEYGSGIILVQCDADGRTKAWGGGFDVRAYVGAERQACTAAINYAPSWLTINVTNNASGTPVVRYSWQQGQAASNAYVTMGVTTTDVSGAEVTYPCTLNVTTVRDGAAGAAGEDGYGFVPVDGTFVPIHTNPDDTTRAGRLDLKFDSYRGTEELTITRMTFLGPSWITATQSTIDWSLLTLTWPDGETLVDSVGCSFTVTIDDRGTTRYEHSEIVIGAVKDGADGYSPTVTVQPIAGGHEVTVTDAGGSQSFDVMDGRDGQKLTKTLSGTLLTAEDAYAAPPVDVTAYGNSTQLTTTGKNLLDRGSEEVGYINSAGGQSGSSDWLRSGYIPVTAGETYTFTPNSTAGSSAYGCWYDADHGVLDTFPSGPTTQTAPDGAAFMRVIYRATSVDVQLEIGSTSTEYEPYSGGKASPRPDWPQPVNSVDALILHAAGKNLFDISKVIRTSENVTVDGTTITTVGTRDIFTGTSGASATVDDLSKVMHLPAGTYTISCGKKSGSNLFLRKVAVDGSISELVASAANSTSWVTSFTLDSPTYVTCRATNQIITDLQIVAGSTATAYEPYVGTSTTIDLDGHQLRSLPDGTRDELTLTPDGTAYRVTLTQRVGVVDMGTLTWTNYGSAATQKFTATISDIPAEGWSSYVGYCTCYTVTRAVAVSTAMADDTICRRATNHVVMARDSRFVESQDVAAFKNAVSGEYLTYALTSPVIHDLGTVTLPTNPAPDMTAWADGGSATPSLSLTYERDLGIVIADMQAEVERTWAQLAPVEQETATANHAVGTYLVLGGTLCKVTRAIAIGETVAIGTNVAATTVAAELLAIQA